MKRKIKIKEVDSDSKYDLNLPSKIVMKTWGEGLDYARRLKLKNNGGLWVHPDETKISITMYDSNNTIGKPEVTIKLRNCTTVSMSFLDLCYLRDILVHTKDLGLNLFNETILDTEE
jgi:hypothetical protein